MDKNSISSENRKKELGGVTMNRSNFKSLNLSKLQNKKSIIISSKEALKDVTPIDWNQEVLTGKKKIVINCNK